MDYAMLIGPADDDGSIKRWVSDDEVDAITILTEAQDWIYSRLRDWRMLSIDTTLTMSTSAETLTAPTDFIKPVSFNITGTDKGRLELFSPERIEKEWAYDSDGNLVTGKPGGFYMRGSTIQLNKKPDSAYTTRLLYYAKPADLGNSNTTNFLTDFYPRILRCACVAFAYEWKRKTDEKTYWLNIAAAEIEARHMQSDLDMAAVVDAMDTDHRSIV